MSGWGAYTTALVATKNISQAAIVGFDGVTWASSDAKGFVISVAEAKNIVAGFKDPSGLRASGLYIAGVKYITLGCDDANIQGKKGTGGVVCAKSKKAVVVGVYAADSGIQPGPANDSTVKMSLDLQKKGF
jgi:profilin